MKNKRFLILYLLISALLVGCLSTQAQQPSLDYEPLEILEDDMNIVTPLAQNDVTPTIKQATNFQSYNPPLVDQSLIDKYGILGFTLVTCLGLVVYIVKQDRKTMSEQSEDMKGLTAAIAANTSATKELALSIQAEIRQMGVSLNLRFDALEKSLDRNKNGA